MIQKPSIVNCAIYCRKSSEEGLMQAFNSLDAQRAAGEAYIESQRGLGWRCLPHRYEDGGVSGGTLERAALKQLLADIRAGAVNTVVVYKLDRLTRSIRDFGRIMEVFEVHKVSLVSVTQSLDTSNSMGRLMLHVLLSFAQFERELASERTSDKIALSRKRGQWTGGRPVLGYDYAGSKLTLNPAEAKIVRRIYDRYIQDRSMSRVLAWLDAEGINNKKWTTRAGRTMGGCRFVKSTLSQLLNNPLFVGLVPHKGATYPGQHQRIIDDAVAARVRQILTENAVAGSTTRRPEYQGLLAGVVRCGCCDAPMTHSVTRKGKNVGYRYYVCTKRRSVGNKRCAMPNVPAEELERIVVGRVRGFVADQNLAGHIADLHEARAREELRDLSARLILAQADMTEAEQLVVRAKSAEASEAHRAASGRLEQIQQAIIACEARLKERADVYTQISEFDGLWSALTPTEKRGLLGHAISLLEFDGNGRQVRIYRCGEVGASARDEAPVAVKFHVVRAAHGRVELREGEAPAKPVLPSGPAGIAKLMAQAIRIGRELRAGVRADMNDVARAVGVTGARVSQLLALTLLAPDIQEALIFMTKPDRGHERMGERHLRAIAQEPDWNVQRRKFAGLIGGGSLSAA